MNLKFLVGYILASALLPVLTVCSFADPAFLLEHKNVSKHFRYLGTYQQKAFYLKESQYFISVNAAEWHSSLSDCKNYFGDNASLVSIETEEELKAFQSFLKNTDSSVGQFWMGGKFDTEKQKFVWVTGNDFGSWAPWDTGFPDSKYSVTRVYGNNVAALKLRTKLQTATLRYVCELNGGVVAPPPPPSNETAVTCDQASDLVLVLDASGSVGSANFQKTLQFADKLVHAWMKNQASRTSVITFSTLSKVLYTLPESITLSESEIRKKILTAKYDNGGTRSDIALQTVLQEFVIHNRSSYLVPNIMLFGTDGASEHTILTKSAAQAVHRAGIVSFSLGIGSNLSDDELLFIAENKKDHVFKAKNFKELEKIMRTVSTKLCGK